jgi:hypothetical protein
MALLRNDPLNWKIYCPEKSNFLKNKYYLLLKSYHL